MERYVMMNSPEKQETWFEETNLMEYITMCLYSTNKVEHWYVRDN